MDVKKGTITVDHFVQGVLIADDEAYILEPHLRLANGTTIALLYSDLRARGERAGDNPVSQLLEINAWYEMLVIVQIGLGERKVTYSPFVPSGTRLELASIKTKVLDEVIKVNKVIQGIILDLSWDAASVPYLAVAGPRVYTHPFVLIETAIGKMVLSYKALQERLGDQIKQIMPGGYLEWEPARHDILAIIAKYNPEPGE